MEHALYIRDELFDTPEILRVLQDRTNPPLILQDYYKYSHTRIDEDGDGIDAHYYTRMEPYYLNLTEKEIGDYKMIEFIEPSDSEAESPASASE